jgi:hypothetical protein
MSERVVVGVGVVLCFFGVGSVHLAITTAGDRNVRLAIVVVIATALVFGFLAAKFRERILLWVTAIGGAGLILSALGSTWPDTLGFLRHPSPGGEQAIGTLLWMILAAAGWLTQRRLFPRALNPQPSATGPSGMSKTRETSRTRVGRRALDGS